MATIKPTTLGELQLYKVLQRSNLLSYYTSFISQGGDDVQQLCEAGEEEFLEIMALVEMASKPLHVRRLQKALQEWVTQPTIFQSIGINYLPSQSIPLTALGMDATELMPPSQSPSTSTNGVNYARDCSSVPAAHSSRSKMFTNGNGLKSRTNGKGNHSNSRTEKINVGNGNGNHSPSNNDYENNEGNGVMNILQGVIERLLPPSKNQEKNNVIPKLKADNHNEDLVSALESRDESRIELEIQRFIKTRKSTDGTATTRHEILLNEAAVKLAMADKRLLLNRNELLSLAERAVSEAESTISRKRRRSSSHLHGSTCQNRVQEVNNQIWEIRAHRQNLHKRISDAKPTKNVLKENEYKTRLERWEQDEAVLLKERNELLGRLKGKSAESPKASTQKTSFSSELADLAKAHNLTFGSLQSSEIVTPTAPWDDNDPSETNYTQNADEQLLSEARNSNSPSWSSGLSPPQLEDLDKIQENSDNYLVKTEANSEGRYPATTSRASKRKHASDSLNEERTSKAQKSHTSSDGGSD